MVGDLALFNEISTSLKENCGARWGKRMAKPGQLTEARRLIGVSTPREVKHQDGFRGTWDPEVQPPRVWNPTAWDCAALQALISKLVVYHLVVYTL